VVLVNAWKKLYVTLLVLSGCDPFYGPILRNSYGFDVEVTVSYADGESMTTTWPSCRTSYIGKNKIGIEKVSVARGGITIREITSQEIRDFVTREENGGGNSAWSVGERGISKFSVSSDKTCVEESSRSTPVSR
jgi:hypothetical protein